LRHPLVLRGEVEQDLASARDWYDTQRAGLGDEFLEQVALAFEQVATKPRLCGLIWEDVRASRLKRFPYIVYYRILDASVQILAVLHGSRDTSAWRSRA
jgi:plasmid stabilization system protein ParE